MILLTYPSLFLLRRALVLSVRAPLQISDHVVRLYVAGGRRDDVTPIQPIKKGLVSLARSIGVLIMLRET